MVEHETYYSKMKYVNDFRLSNCTAMRYKRLHIEDVSNGVVTFTREYEQNKSVTEMKLEDFVSGYEVSGYCITNISKLASALRTLENKHRRSLEKLSKDTVNVQLTMTLNVSKDKLDEIKKLKYHVDYFLNLDEYPEVKGVSNVEVKVL